ncbi:hydroxyacylglutathione hydrolase [Rhizomicrobium palustre]|uniref:Hydroxyacylglutathione hydrolase n=1 Tax=Rhizomicrobium palustre TaxID=189966 RepID=A0A846MY57_9PROT|nr:hydroxyacylglutathione hydrolase [Rhizomicrobium palustre]NIK87940.1 hydroxyacylglutathione hydrolase [Rhizomicrobium palustre]
MSLAVEIIPCLEDNYAYLITAKDLTAVIDPPEAESIMAALKGRHLTHILNTHHHHDHSGGNLSLKEQYGACIVGPQSDWARIPGITDGATEAQGWQFGPYAMTVLEVPGHTRGAVAYALGGAVFTGDTLFSLGCGRLFEGTPEMMVASLKKIASLPDHTAVYPGHEYTLTNARFALSLESGNAALQARAEEVAQLRKAGKPAIPSTIGQEKATNPFLRTHSAEIRKSLGLEGADDVTVFAEIRRRKDAF